MVMAAETGSILAMQMDSDPEAALRDAMEQAATAPLRPNIAQRPDRIVCLPSLAPRVALALARLEIGQPPLMQVASLDACEDAFDSLLGYLAGRAQPEDLPTPDDWRLLIELAWRYHQAMPWERWTDETDLVLQLRIGRRAATFCATILGNEGIQRGLVLYPGASPPPELGRTPAPGQLPLPPGTLMFNLDPREQLPPELVAKAQRYGWAEREPLVPVFLGLDGQGGVDLGRKEARWLTLAIAAVIEIDRLGPVLLEREAAAPVAGELVLADGPTGRFTIRRLAPEQVGSGAFQFRVHRIKTDLLGRALVRVSIGTISSNGLAQIRRQAKIHRPAPGGMHGLSSEIPLVTISVGPRSGPRVAARIAHDDPYGVTWMEVEDRALMVLVCAEAAHGLVELAAAEPALARFERRTRATGGLHVVLVAGPGTTPEGVGPVYGLFECRMPPEMGLPLSPDRPR